MKYLKFLPLILIFCGPISHGQIPIDKDKKDEKYWNMVLSARKAQDLMDRDRLDSIAHQILEYAEEKNNENYKHYGLFFKAESLTRTDPNQAIDIAKKSLEFFEKQDDHSKCSRISNSIAHGFSNTGKIEEALVYYRKAIEHSEKFHLSMHKMEVRFRIGVLYNMGYALIKKGQLERGAQFLYEALETLGPEQDSMIIASVNVQLGNIEMTRERFGEALEYYKKSHNLSPSICHACHLISTMSIAGAYQEMGHLDSALQYYDELFPMLRKSNNKVSLCVGLYNISELYILKDKPELALENGKELVEISKKGGFIKHLVNGYYVLANANLELGNYREARNAIETSFTYLEELNDYRSSSSIHELASEIYESIGEYEESLSHQKSFKLYSDSLLNKESLAKIDELIIQHEAKEKEGKIKELEKEKELSALRFRQNLTQWIGFFLICGLCAGLYILYINRKRLIAKKQKDSIEQRLLRSQMNPHFIFNAISSIQNYLFEKSETKTALNYLSKFAKLMRQILENSREEYIPLSDEIDTLNNYLELQQLRYNNTFGYEIILDQKLQNQDLLVPPLIAQPFVENAIEHGLIYRRPNGQVKIEFKSEDENLVLSIEDNGVGKKSTTIAPATNENKKSPLATVITKERLNLISEATKNKFEMIISELKTGGTLVTIQLPKVIAS